MAIFRKSKKDQPEFTPVDWGKVIEKARKMEFRYPWKGQVRVIPTRTIQKICLVFSISIIGYIVWTVAKSFGHERKMPEKPINVEELIKKNPTDEAELTIRYKELRRNAMDSLVDNNILTVENIKAVEALYPDSLCDCK